MTQTPFTNIRVAVATRDKLSELLSRINNKPHGRKLRIDELVDALAPLFTDDMVAPLQSKTYSNADLIEMEYRKRIAQGEKISKDDFLGEIFRNKNF